MFVSIVYNLSSSYGGIMNCKKCKAKLENTAIYCSQCGVPTGFVKEHLSAFNTFSQVVNTNKGKVWKHFAVSGPAYLFGLIPIILINELLTRYLGGINHNLYYGLFLLLSAIFLPFFIMPLAKKDIFSETRSRISDYFSNFKYYFKTLLICELFALYLIALYIICQGDPILNLVHLVMFFYGIAIFFHAPSLVYHEGLSVLNAIKTAYISGKHTIRWQNFFLTLMMLLISVPVVIAYFWSEGISQYNDFNSMIFSNIIRGIATIYSFAIIPLIYQIINTQYQKYRDHQIFSRNIEKEIS